ncbi:hypothetical protein FRC19_009849 [Serendipita sp. 401]|nr:hypothetical protein FRC19_009849 [Serendipita sp. 401]KAG9052889.1 hypothetical protein FS842_009098 [Serendipita sp. 407]
MLAQSHVPRQPRQAESVTERLERLRLEESRHLRNTTAHRTNSSSVTRNGASMLSGPSLPIENATLPAAPGTNIDTWNIANVENQATVQRPTSLRQRIWLPPLNPRPSVTGPAAPRSWLSPSGPGTRGVTHTQARARVRAPVPAQAGPTEKQRKSNRRNAQRAKESDIQLMEETYGAEYWFRSAKDPRWASWRETALHLVFSRMAASRPQNTSMFTNAFVPFDPPSEHCRVPTLFEMTLKVIFETIRGGSGEEEEVDIVDILDYLPPYTQRCVLRYAALYHQLDEQALRRVYGSQANRTAGDDTRDSIVKDELVISGRDVSSSILDQLSIYKSTSSEKKDPQMEPTEPTGGYPQAIVLFQTPFLQKRHLSLFPVTITTLALIALPPPPTYNKSREPDPCLCQWCTTRSEELARTTGVGSSKVSSSQRKQEPLVPTTSASLVASLTNLPALFPSLITLDVSYNPWMSAESTLTNVKVPPAPKGRVFVKEYGILGRWDLRLWGRLKVLGVRACFGPGHSTFQSDSEPGTTTVHGALEGEYVGGDGLSTCERLQIKSALVERWERTLFLMARTVEVIWKDTAET